MKKIYILFGFLILILIMLLLNNWQSGNWQEKLSQIGLPELKKIDIEELSKSDYPDNGVYKEFSSPDGKLKISHSDSWLITENQELLAAAVPKEWQEKYNLKTVFLAQCLQAGKFAQLMIQEGIFNISAEEIIEEMEKINQEQELSMEIVKSDIQDDKAVFEARYLTPNSPNLYSKEEILSVGEKTYLIAFITLEQDWPGFSEQVDYIFSSVQIVQ